MEGTLEDDLVQSPAPGRICCEVRLVLRILFRLVLKVSKHRGSAGFGQTAPLLPCPQGVHSKSFWFAAGLSLAELCENSWCPVLIWAIIIQSCFVFGLAAPCSGMALRA